MASALTRISLRRLAPPNRCQRLRVRAVEGQYNHIVPNFDYINAVLDAFPEGAVANPDEARVTSVSLLHSIFIPAWP
jgi:hypothetical protein